MSDRRWSSSQKSENGRGKGKEGRDGLDEHRLCTREGESTHVRGGAGRWYRRKVQRRRGEGMQERGER